MYGQQQSMEIVEYEELQKPKLPLKKGEEHGWDKD